MINYPTAATIFHYLGSPNINEAKAGKQERETFIFTRWRRMLSIVVSGVYTRRQHHITLLSLREVGCIL